MNKFSRWNNWDSVKPTPGNYVYMRDAGCSWEIGYCVEESGYVGLLVVDDPSHSWLECDQWQSLPVPGEDWNKGDPPPKSFVYVDDPENGGVWERLTIKI